jgi:CRP-like cAMP-binding protein
MTMISAVARTAAKRADARLQIGACFIPGKRGTLAFRSSSAHTSRQWTNQQPGALIRRQRFHSSQSRYQSSTAKRKKATLAGNEAGGGSSSQESAFEGFSWPRFRDATNRYLNQPRTMPIPRWVSPQHVQMSLSSLFGHASFVLVAISYAVDDHLQLRMLAIAGSGGAMVFTYFHPNGQVLWLPFKWNVLFIAINGYRVMKVYTARFFADQLSPLMLHMHDHHFYVMDKVDFASLVRLGTTERYSKGQVVVAQDQDNRYVRLVLKGELNVQRDGQITYRLQEGNFISECGLHAGLLLRGNIDSCCDVISNSDDVTLLRWDRTELMHLLEVNTNIQRALKAVMSWDIVSKLKSQRALLESGIIVDPEEWTRKRREQTMDRYKNILHNMLWHPQYLNKRKEELTKYRDIHHIDDAQHQMALKEMGWTLAEFAAGRKEGEIDEDEVEMHQYGWRWYSQDLYLRLFG